MWEAKIALYRLVVHRNRPPACFVPEQAPGSPRPTNLFRNKPPAYKPPACMHPLNAPEQPPAAAGFCLAMANQAEIFAGSLPLAATLATFVKQCWNHVCLATAAQKRPSNLLSGYLYFQ